MMLGFSYLKRRTSAPKKLWAIYKDGAKVSGAEGIANLRAARALAKERGMTGDVVFGQYREDIGTAPSTLAGPLVKRTK